MYFFKRTRLTHIPKKITYNCTLDNRESKEVALSA